MPEWFSYLFGSLADLGFTPRDVRLMWWCSLFSTLGSVAQVLISFWVDLELLPRDDSAAQYVGSHTALRRASWMVARIFAGALLGLLLALYMTGALTEGTSVVGRVLAFATLLGYAAPSVWESQKRVTQRMVGRVMERISGT